MSADSCSPRANGLSGSFRGFLPADVADALAACAASGGGIRTFNSTAGNAAAGLPGSASSLSTHVLIAAALAFAAALALR